MKTTIGQLKRIVSEATKAQSKWNPRTNDELFKILLDNGFEKGGLFVNTYRNAELDLRIYPSNNSLFLTSYDGHKFLNKFRHPWTAAHEIQRITKRGKFTHEGVMLTCVRNDRGSKSDLNVKTGEIDTSNYTIVTTDGCPLFVGDVITFLQNDQSVGSSSRVELNGVPTEIVGKVDRRNFVEKKQSTVPNDDSDATVYVNFYVRAPNHSEFYELFNDTYDVLNAQKFIERFEGCSSVRGGQIRKYPNYRLGSEFGIDVSQTVVFRVDRSFNLIEFLPRLTQELGDTCISVIDRVERITITFVLGGDIGEY